MLGFLDAITSVIASQQSTTPCHTSHFLKFKYINRLQNASSSIYRAQVMLQLASLRLYCCKIWPLCDSSGASSKAAAVQWVAQARVEKGVECQGLRLRQGPTHKYSEGQNLFDISLVKFLERCKFIWPFTVLLFLLHQVHNKISTLFI